MATKLGMLEATDAGLGFRGDAVLSLILTAEGALRVITLLGLEGGPPGAIKDRRPSRIVLRAGYEKATHGGPIRI